jgi:oxalate decarboxylase/phosphoglucose isomerase-like protein (cupin superfamily)
LQFVEDVFAIPPKVTRFVILEVQAGDLVVIPPNCAHIAVIPGNEPMVTSNWVARAFDSQYTPIRLMRGAAYYIVKDGDGYAWERNPTYPDAPQPEIAKGSDWEKRGLPTGIPAYKAFFEDPKAFEFLVRP